MGFAQLGYVIIISHPYVSITIYAVPKMHVCMNPPYSYLHVRPGKVICCKHLALIFPKNYHIATIAIEKWCVYHC